MIKAINTIINHSGYPHFTANQVLSKDDLNHLVNYLDEQNRLTRAYFIGMGIVGGLEVSSVFDTTSSHIQISAGCGITSEGYAIALADTKLTHYDVEKEVLVTSFASSQKQESEKSPENIKLIELFAPSEKDTTHILLPQLETAFQELLKNRVLVVFCELEKIERDTCRLNYDNLSNEVNLKYRFFLIRSTDVAEKLLKTGFSTEQNIAALFTARNNYLQEELEQKQFRDFAPKIQRFGYKQSDNISILDLTKISDYQAFWQEYRRICENAIASIDNAFRKLSRLFSPFFSSFNPNSQADFSKLKENLEEILKGIQAPPDNPNPIPSEKPEPSYAIQYFYDYLSQLVAAFDELAAAAFDLMDDYAPDTQRFPKFLMLGIVPELKQSSKVYEPASPYRSYFTQPPIYNGNQQRVKQVRYLYDRLINLCQDTSFYLLPFSDTPLKITPSQDSSVPLSEQAIPYYLDYPRVYRYWSYDAYRKGRSHLIPAYFSHKNNDNTPAILPGEDLVYRLDKHNFYRIEGHIGKANGDVLKRIKEYQQLYNLAFDVITLKIGNQASLQDLNISGQFDDLEIDFKQLKDNFQELWYKNTDNWSKNVFLQTLKQFVFEQPSLTTAIINQQFSNPILELARKPENYQFIPVPSSKPTSVSFKLYLGDENKAQIARYVNQNLPGEELSEFSDLIIEFTALSPDLILQQQHRIANEIAAIFSLENVTYNLVVESSRNQKKYYIKLEAKEKFKFSSTQEANLILLSFSNFVVVSDSNNRPLIRQKEFQDFETLYNLLPDNKMGNTQAANELKYHNYEIKRLVNTYQQRLEKLIELHLFNKFAQQHPGVEHLGGVPKGGTFILVYVDEKEIDQALAADKDLNIYKLRASRTAAIKEVAALPPDRFKESISSWEQLTEELNKRKDIVIGDFCLPYRCSSDAPAVSYIIAKPRPIILLEKTVFCEDDNNEYQFILEPEGGTVKGEGVLFAGIKQIFQPSRINQASKENLAKGIEVAITFTYTVNDTYDTFTVTIYPLPDAGFIIGKAPEKDYWCINDEPVSLIPTLVGGTFQALDAQGKVIENAIANNQFNPRTIKLGANETSTRVTLKYTITSSQGCTQSLEKILTIYALPDASFQVGSDPQKTSFCGNNEAVTLIPKVGGGKFQVFNAQGKVIENAIANNQFLPSAVTIGETETSTQVTLKYEITSDKGCHNSTQQILTIFAVPDASFQVGSPENQTSFCGNDEAVTLIPKVAGGKFQVIDAQGKVLENAIVADVGAAIANSQFLPKAVKLGEAEKSTQVTLKYEITSDKGCSNSAQKTLTIFAVPDASFQVGSEENQTSFCANDEAVNLIPKVAGGTFQVIDAQGKVIENVITNSQFLPKAVKLGEAEKSTQVTLKYEITSDKGCHNSTQKTLTIFAVPDASFQVGSEENQTSFCANDEAVNLIPNVTGGTFQVLDAQGTVIENAIAADVGAAIANNQFNPSAVKLGANETSTQVTLKYTITSSQGCTNSTQKTLTIFAVPDATFQVGSEENQTSFCANDEAVTLIPNVTGGTFQVLDAQGKLIENAFVAEVGAAIANNQFHPSAIKLGANETSTQVTLKYTITSSQGCTNSTQKTLTIFAVPDATFQVGSEENQTSFCENAQSVELIPKVAGGKFRVLIGDEDISDDALDYQSNSPQLIPSAVKIGDARQVTLTIEYTIVNENNCTSQHVENLTVHRVPVGDFEAEISQINANGFSVRVFDILPAQNSSMRLDWEHPNGEANTSNPVDNQFLISYNYDFNNWQTGAQVSITLQVITPENLGGCISNPVTKNVAIPFGAVQGFNLVIRSGTTVIDEISLGSNNSFILGELDKQSESPAEYTIEAVTIPATLDSIVFTYTAPGDEATVSTPMNTPYPLPDGWFNIVGDHIIQAQPVKEINNVLWLGVTSTTIIHISEGDTGTNTPTPSTPKSATLLNRLRVLFDTNEWNIKEIKGVNPNG